MNRQLQSLVDVANRFPEVNLHDLLWLMIGLPATRELLRQAKAEQVRRLRAAR